MIKEKVTHEDLILYEVLKHPVFCGEFLSRHTEEDFTFAYYQVEILTDFHPYISICCARAIGKTLSIVNFITWVLVNNMYPNNYILYTVPSKVHLQPVWDGLVRNFRTHEFLRNFVGSTAGINSSDYSLKLSNNSQLICRIAGQTGDGRNLIGLHTPVIIADETGYFPIGAFNEAQPALNTWMNGFKEYTIGVPTGLRENNVLYHTDIENDNYTKHRVSAADNPRITEADRKRAIEQYGGEDSEDFKHYFLGEHGSPVFAVFDRHLMEISDYPVYKATLDGLKLKEHTQEYATQLSFLPAAPKTSTLIMGVDLGYQDPTAIYLMYLDKNDRFKFHAKIQLNKVIYSIQEDIIDYLDTKFKPHIIGIDEGNAGMAVVQNLTTRDEYAHKNFSKRMQPVSFGGTVSLGTNRDGEETKVRVKPFIVSLTQEYVNKHKIVFSSTDDDTISELERMSYIKNPSTGDIVYRTLTIKGGKKGEDHFTSALLCSMFAYYMRYEMANYEAEEVKLLSPGWFR